MIASLLFVTSSENRASCHSGVDWVQGWSRVSLSRGAAAIGAEARASDKLLTDICFVEGLFSGGVLLATKEALRSSLTAASKTLGFNVPPSLIGFVSGAGGGASQALVMGPTSLIVTGKNHLPIVERTTYVMCLIESDRAQQLVSNSRRKTETFPL